MLACVDGVRQRDMTKRSGGAGMARYRRIRRYTRPAIWMHWLVGIGIAFLFVHGFYMVELPEPGRTASYNLHRTIGVLVFALVLVRIAWRIAHPPPALNMPPMQAYIADFTHTFIYALLVVNGVSGIVGWIASGDAIVLCGVELRHAGERHAPVADLTHIIGIATSRGLLAAVLLHVLGVAKHLAVDRDHLLSRMWPGRTILVTIQQLRKRYPRCAYCGHCFEGGRSPPRAG